MVNASSNVSYLVLLQPGDECYRFGGYDVPAIPVANLCHQKSNCQIIELLRPDW